MKVQRENLFLCDNITHAEEGGVSKPVILKEKAEQIGAQVWEKPPFFHFYSDEGMGKIRQEERNETVLHGRIELVDLRDIHFS